MKIPQSLQVLAPLFQRPFFTSKEAKALGVYPALLNYYVKIGWLKLLQRGMYQTHEFEGVSSFKWADLIEGVYSVHNGVICLISALSIYELTEEIPRQHWIAVPHSTSVKKNRKLKIARFRNIELGKTCIELDGILVPIFDQERTIIDAFRLLSKEIAIKALKNALLKVGKNRIDLVKLQMYATKLRVHIDPYLMALTT